MGKDSTNYIALVVDDHPLFRDSFCLLLQRLGLFNTVKITATRKELVQALLENTDSSITIFLDFYLDDHSSLPLITEIKQLNRNAKIIMVSSVTSPALASTIMMQKPHGFISKSSDVDAITQCVQMVRKDKFFVCPVIGRILDEADEASHAQFTDRDLQTLQYFARGLSVLETAEAIHLSRHTVVSHRRNMMAKSGTNSITELLAYAHRMGFIT